MNQATPPRWNLDTVFPSADAASPDEALRRLRTQLEDLERHFTEQKIDPGPPLQTTPDQVALFEQTLTLVSRAAEDHRVLSLYWAGRCWADGADAEAAAQAAAVRQATSTLPALQSRLQQWVTRLERERLVEASPIAAAHRYWLERTHAVARHQLPPEQELLLAQLRPSGMQAWQNLHRDLTSNLTGELDGETASIATLRSELGRPEPKRRHAAYEAAQRAWQSIESPAAACLNAIRGETLTLAAHRGWAGPLDLSLHANGVDSRILHVLHEAVRAALPALHRFARAKAALLGVRTLSYPDIAAPLPEEPQIGWDAALEMTLRAAGAFADDFAALVRRAGDNAWIDAEPRPGKRQTALSMPMRDGQSRLLVNFDDSMDSVLSLAHELGHAYHYHLLRDSEELQRIPPLALAETASLVSETLLLEHGTTDPTPEQYLALMNADLIGHFQVVVDTYSRFLFEHRYLRQREEGTVSAKVISGLLHEAQCETYGDSVDVATLDRYAWISKPHYYAETPFTNWPYYFGLFLGLGIREGTDGTLQPDALRYLLSNSGRHAPEVLARRCGIDLGSEEFWMASAAGLARRVETFCRAADAYLNNAGHTSADTARGDNPVAPQP
ncbi:M3 family metallopeptidase [Streptomyces sp. DT2A-34]|uniref:M3 family metallopeptidase n=1 Tax=Streptomyces sp. DT2A-34 TaxID=3051182 RepID=UPI00265C544A|nr:M3 family metallopeptidase [Streptomyces sp. DT2A-34]MDO0917757.1 M3 family metallopeptidase [Streptomyces sp. DT2A-34]